MYNSIATLQFILLFSLFIFMHCYNRFKSIKFCFTHTRYVKYSLQIILINDTSLICFANKSAYFLSTCLTLRSRDFQKINEHHKIKARNFNLSVSVWFDFFLFSISTIDDLIRIVMLRLSQTRNLKLTHYDFWSILIVWRLAQY